MLIRCTDNRHWKTLFSSRITAQTGSESTVYIPDWLQGRYEVIIIRTEAFLFTFTVGYQKLWGGCVVSCHLRHESICVILWLFWKEKHSQVSRLHFRKFGNCDSSPKFWQKTQKMYVTGMANLGYITSLGIFTAWIVHWCWFFQLGHIFSQIGLFSWNTFQSTMQILKFGTAMLFQHVNPDKISGLHKWCASLTTLRFPMIIQKFLMIIPGFKKHVSVPNVLHMESISLLN